MCILQLYPACYYTLYAHTSWKTSASCVLWVAGQFIGNLELIFKRCSWAECGWDLALCSVSVLLPPHKRILTRNTLYFFYFILSYLFLTFLGKADSCRARCRAAPHNLESPGSFTKPLTPPTWHYLAHFGIPRRHYRGYMEWFSRRYLSVPHNAYGPIHAK